ncbi:hypothetical protein QUF72_19820 [Desulfobacterales bacterium HSG2]|nr:hypothetical protein [Desulfobacterales bacterium HSG2]
MAKRERDQPIIHFREWRKGHFFSLRKWEGLVESVSETGFTARLRDVAREVPDERVEIDFDELTNADEKRLFGNSCYSFYLVRTRCYCILYAFGKSKKLFSAFYSVNAVS